MAPKVPLAAKVAEMLRAANSRPSTVTKAIRTSAFVGPGSAIAATTCRCTNELTHSPDGQLSDRRAHHKGSSQGCSALDKSCRASSLAAARATVTRTILTSAQQPLVSPFVGPTTAGSRSSSREVPSSPRTRRRHAHPPRPPATRPMGSTTSDGHRLACPRPCTRSRTGASAKRGSLTARCADRPVAPGQSAEGRVTSHVGFSHIFRAHGAMRTCRARLRKHTRRTRQRNARRKRGPRRSRYSRLIYLHARPWMTRPSSGPCGDERVSDEAVRTGIAFVTDGQLRLACASAT